MISVIGIISIVKTGTVFSCILLLEVVAKFLLYSFLEKRTPQLYVRFSIKFQTDRSGLKQLAERFTQIQGGLTAVERINELLDEEIQIKDSLSAKHFSENVLGENHKFKGKIEFKNVNFYYKKGEHILKDLSFLIHPGEHVAFVGPTGSYNLHNNLIMVVLPEPVGPTKATCSQGFIMNLNQAKF